MGLRVAARRHPRRVVEAAMEVELVAVHLHCRRGAGRAEADEDAGELARARPVVEETGVREYLLDPGRQALGAKAVYVIGPGDAPYRPLAVSVAPAVERVPADVVRAERQVVATEDLLEEVHVRRIA